MAHIPCTDGKIHRDVEAGVPRETIKSTGSLEAAALVGLGKASKTLLDSRFKRQVQTPELRRHASFRPTAVTLWITAAPA
jgi:hypothetical protein